MVLDLLYVLALGLQLAVVVYGVRMLKLVKWLDNWTPAWIMFILASALILVRRSLWTYWVWANLKSDVELEATLTVFVSVFSLLFVLFMHKIFTKYLHTDGKNKEE